MTLSWLQLLEPDLDPTYSWNQTSILHIAPRLPVPRQKRSTRGKRIAGAHFTVSASGG